MTINDLINLEKFINYLSKEILQKSSWQDVGKAEWMYVAQTINEALEKQFKKKGKNASKVLIGENYIYEHIIINKMRIWKEQMPITAISSPSFSKLNLIAGALGFSNYVELIKSTAEKFNFNELRIGISTAEINLPLLENLTGHWYSYNRNLPYRMGQKGEQRIWRSALEIYKSGNDFLVERSGKDNHKYYGRVTAYADYVFIIMNSNTFIRQRHFISRIKDATTKLKNASYEIQVLSFVSTCISFNEEPIALYEIFEKQKSLKNFSMATVDFSLDSPDIPKHILAHLKDIGNNRITQH
ncbi:MAG TPA: hypothetical protein VM888_05790 [Chitinophagaceae bacterium]|jgi:hypothetical protein|nr:hypothetical protein [Chitinophagaceae bacterium]